MASTSTSFPASTHYPTVCEEIRRQAISDQLGTEDFFGGFFAVFSKFLSWIFENPQNEEARSCETCNCWSLKQKGCYANAPNRENLPSWGRHNSVFIVFHAFQCYHAMLSERSRELNNRHWTGNKVHLVCTSSGQSRFCTISEKCSYRNCLVRSYRFVFIQFVVESRRTEIRW